MSPGPAAHEPLERGTSRLSTGVPCGLGRALRHLFSGRGRRQGLEVRDAVAVMGVEHACSRARPLRPLARRGREQLRPVDRLRTGRPTPRRAPSMIFGRPPPPGCSRPRREREPGRGCRNLSHTRQAAIVIWSGGMASSNSRRCIRRPRDGASSIRAIASLRTAHARRAASLSAELVSTSWGATSTAARRPGPSTSRCVSDKQIGSFASWRDLDEQRRSSPCAT